jgi:hypothetical protein
VNRGNSSAKKGAGSSATSISPLTALCLAVNLNERECVLFEERKEHGGEPTERSASH